MDKIIIVLLILSISGCSSPTNKNIDIITADNIHLKGTYLDNNNNNNNKEAILLIHMLNSDRSAYDSLFSSLKDKYTLLSIDSRGHGESEGSWKAFSKQDFKNMQLDVQAGISFLRKKGYSKIYLVGASIGANTILNYASVDPRIEKIILLSPGLYYRGVDVTKALDVYESESLIIASKEDTYAFNSSKEIYNKLKVNTNKSTFIQLIGVSHGTNMLDLEIEKKIKEWLKK